MFIALCGFFSVLTERADVDPFVDPFPAFRASPCRDPAAVQTDRAPKLKQRVQAAWSAANTSGLSSRLVTSFPVTSSMIGHQSVSRSTSFFNQ